MVNIVIMESAGIHALIHQTVLRSRQVISANMDYAVCIDTSLYCLPYHCTSHRITKWSNILIECIVNDLQSVREACARLCADGSKWMVYTSCIGSYCMVKTDSSRTLTRNSSRGLIKWCALFPSFVFCGDVIVLSLPQWFCLGQTCYVLKNELHLLLEFDWMTRSASFRQVLVKEFREAWRLVSIYFQGRSLKTHQPLLMTKYDYQTWTNDLK